MSGRINDEDIAAVRQRARIDEVIGAYVALRNAGGGSLKGLCPFHDEKTPSFTVTPARGFFYCFGCGEGGDVITFLQKHQNLTFVEAVQQLADSTGVQLRVSDDDSQRGVPGMRVKILDANRAAEEFFAEQLLCPEAITARQFLHGRGFERSDAEHFRIGYAPRGGRVLYQHLRGRGFTDEVLRAAGLAREGGRDFFVGRLLWPIRDSGKAVLGFGGRRIHDDDRLPAKYINTPETPVYKKSTVLYGLDLARQAIGRKSQAVVVEGYTDVMAAHIAGVDTAVASCGTAFGDDHARLLRRLMGGADAFHGEVIFTFDGDAAGQAAALKVFKGDQNFIAQTYVAIEPTGLDPCDLRLQSGDAAVRELVGRRVPLYRFVMTNVLAGYDLDRADGRLGALREAAGLLSSIRDASLVSEYLRELAGQLGMDLEVVRREVADQARRGRGRVEAPRPDPGGDAAGEVRGRDEEDELPWPDPDDRSLVVERGVLKLMLQHPELFDEAWNGVGVIDFTHPAYQEVLATCQSTPLSEHWPEAVRQQATTPLVAQLVVALTVEPILGTPTAVYAEQYAAKLQLQRLTAQAHAVRSKLQRTNPVEAEREHKALFAELLGLEMERKRLLALSIGD